MLDFVPRPLKNLARRLLFPPPVKEMQEWSIGIFAGEKPWQVVQPDHIVNPVLTRHDISDRDARFVADPFMLRVDATWHMFFEVLDSKTGKGEIGLATSLDGFTWKYRKIVLVEPFHLSYPYVFYRDGAYYMIPETWEAGAVRLYRADAFPEKWTCVATLLELPYVADSSVFHANGYWWMFSETWSEPEPRFSKLSLYFASELTGPWVEHPQSPVVNGNPHTARPAGRVLVDGNRIIRFAQDCAPKYGIRVFAFEVEELSPDRYSERPLMSGAILDAAGSGWNSHGMHHIDAHRLDDGQWIASVDGWRSIVVK